MSYIPRPKQAEAHRCRAKYLLFAGGLGSGKSSYLCAEAIKNAMMYNGNRIVIVRKELSVLRRTTLVTFFNICHPQIIRSYNQTRFEVTFINGSILLFLDADVNKDPQLNKIKGLEIGWFGIDEASEISKTVYDTLKTRLRWILKDGIDPRYEGRLTSNPENCWLINSFIESTNPDEIYILAQTTDNYDENSDYVKNLRDTFKDSPALLRRYLYGDWSLTDSINQLIPSEVISNAANRVQGYGTALGIDCARYGDDSTVFIILKNRNIELIETYPQTSITEIITRAIQLITDYHINSGYVGIDGVGLGAGVIDGLKQQGYEVVEIVGGAKPEEINTGNSFNPFNLRSQMYWQLRESIMNGEIGNITDEPLKVELSAIKYEISADKTVKVISKEVIKKILGRSPDKADALAYANWILKRNNQFINSLWILPCSGR